jgi:predicted TIM-barrel fold metal-dependent hydrolase
MLTKSGENMFEQYDGPLIDAHTHLWDLSMDKHPWLRPAGDFGPKGRFDALKGKNYSLAQYRADIDGTDVIASVHVEALWDPQDGRVNETRWLETLNGGRLASRYVAGVSFDTPATESELRQQAAFERVRGVRQVIAWTPNPDRRMVAEESLARGAGWLAAIPLLLELDLHLELLLYPYQAGDVAALATEFPELPIVVNHIGSPIEQDVEGIARWHDAIATMADSRNVLVKLSAAGAYPIEKSGAAMARLVDPVIDAFGAERVMWGSDFPVGTLVGWSYATYLDAYRQIIARRSVAEQQQIFFSNANQLYRFGL